MDPATESLLAEYHARARAEAKLQRELPLEEGLKRRDEMLLPVGPHTGQLMNILIREARCQRILELGTSFGYSTVWLADAARETGGKVITMELAQNKSAYAQAALARAGLDRHVDLRVGDALQMLKTCEAPIDFVLVDLWKDLYIPCFELFAPKLARGAIVVADNMIEPAVNRPQAQAYRAHVRATGRFDSVLLPVGSGIEVSRLRDH